MNQLIEVTKEDLRAFLNLPANTEIQFAGLLRGAILIRCIEREEKPEKRAFLFPDPHDSV